MCLSEVLVPHRLPHPPPANAGRIPGGSGSSAASCQRPPRRATPGKRWSLVTADNSLEKRINGEGGSTPAGGLAPATAQVRAHYPRGLPG